MQPRILLELDSCFIYFLSPWIILLFFSLILEIHSYKQFFSKKYMHQITNIMINMQEIQIDDYITHNLPFDDINKAFNLMKEGKCLRCVIHMPR